MERIPNVGDINYSGQEYGNRLEEETPKLYKLFISSYRQEKAEKISGSRALDKCHQLMVSSGAPGASTSEADWRAPVAFE